MKWLTELKKALQADKEYDPLFFDVFKYAFYVELISQIRKEVDKGKSRD